MSYLRSGGQMRILLSLNQFAMNYSALMSRSYHTSRQHFTKNINRLVDAGLITDDGYHIEITPAGRKLITSGQGSAR